MTHLWLLLFLNSWLQSEAQGFGINLIKVPEDDRAQIVCTIALLGKYFHSGEALSGSVLYMSITSAPAFLQQSLLKALNSDPEYPWTIVIKSAQEEGDSEERSQFILHEKPQCYFFVIENMEEEDMDELFDSWRSNLNWNPLAQFVVYFSAVEETEEEMTDIMIEILLNFMNKKIYNVNIIGQSEESSLYFGKTVFPYHPDNNCGNRVISIETLDICDYQESEKEEDEDEEGDEEEEADDEGEEEEQGEEAEGEEKEQGEEADGEEEEKEPADEAEGEEKEQGKEAEIGDDKEEPDGEGEEEEKVGDGDDKEEDSPDANEQKSQSDEVNNEQNSPKSNEKDVEDEQAQKKGNGKEEADGEGEEVGQAEAAEDADDKEEEVNDHTSSEANEQKDQSDEANNEQTSRKSIELDVEEEAHKTSKSNEEEQNASNAYETDKKAEDERNGETQNSKSNEEEKNPEQNSPKSNDKDKKAEEDDNEENGETQNSKSNEEEQNPQERENPEENLSKSNEEAEKPEDGETQNSSKSNENEEDGIAQEEKENEPDSESKNLSNPKEPNEQKEENIEDVEKFDKEDQSREEYRKEDEEQLEIEYEKEAEDLEEGRNEKEKEDIPNTSENNSGKIYKSTNLPYYKEPKDKEIGGRKVKNQNSNEQKDENIGELDNKVETREEVSKEDKKQQEIEEKKEVAELVEKKNGNNDIPNTSKNNRVKRNYRETQHKPAFLNKTPLQVEYINHAPPEIQIQDTKTSAALTDNSTKSEYPKLYIEELYRALFLDKFPKDLSGCPLVAAYRPWEPYIFNKADDNSLFTPATDGDGSGKTSNNDTYVDEENDNEIVDDDQPNEDYAIYNDQPEAEGDGEVARDSSEIRLNGIEYKMIQTIAERLHISIEMQVENTNLYHLFQQLIDGDIELVVGGIDEDPSISQFVSSTIPYYQDDLTWCVARAHSTTNLFNFMATFQFSAWVLILIFILTLSISIFMSQRYLKLRLVFFKSYFSINVYVMGIILGQALNLRPIPTSLKLCFGTAFFMALMFSNIYQSFLVSTLTTPKSSYQISHLSEIYQNRMQIMGSVDNVRHLNKEGEIYRYVREQFQMCYNIEDCLLLAAKDHKLAVAVSRQHSFYNPRIPRDSLYCFDRSENIYVYMVTMLMPKKFHLLHKINPVIQHVVESGHLQKWARDLDMRRRINEEIRRAREEAVNSLTLDQVAGSFAFTGLLLLFGIFMFVLEHAVYWLVVKRKTRLKLAKFMHRKLV